MTALNKQALRSKSRAASAGEWIKESGDGWEAICSSDDQANGNFIIAHFEGPDAKANREFSQAANPDTVLALLDALEDAEKRIAELEARPANPINFKESADADYCRGWAWNEVKKELSPEDWTVGDNCTYYGFFCWGWDSRRQFNEQRAAGIGVKGE